DRAAHGQCRRCRWVVPVLDAAQSQPGGVREVSIDGGGCLLSTEAARSDEVHPLLSRLFRRTLTEARRVLLVRRSAREQRWQAALVSECRIPAVVDPGHCRNDGDVAQAPPRHVSVCFPALRYPFDLLRHLPPSTLSRSDRA